MNKPTQLILKILLTFIVIILIVLVAGHYAWLPVGGMVVCFIAIKLLRSLLFPALGKIWSEDDTKQEPEIPDSELKNVKKDNSAMTIVGDGNTEKEYTSMYEELNEKCHPKNFMNPFDELKVKTANSIYSKLIGLGEGNIQELRELRNIAIEHLGISFSTQSVYKKLMEYCNPSIYFSINPYPSEWIDKAAAYYARIENAKDDLLELEKIEEESKDLYEWYRKVILGETTEENEGNSDAVVSDNKEPIIVDSVGEDYKKEPDKSPTPTEQPIDKGCLITLIILFFAFCTGIIILSTSNENTTDEYDVEPISVSTNMENTDSVQHRSKGSMDVVAVNSKENIGGYEFVDLGLSVKWATCNVGANTSDGFGNLYTFAEAQKLSNSEWRVPTKEEIEELLKNCDCRWTTQNGVYGRLFTSKKNGNSIFLPAAGERYGTNVNLVGDSGYYWSSTAYDYNYSDAYCLLFYCDHAYVGCIYLDYGRSVRLVRSL